MRVVCNLIKFYEGGLQYHIAKKLPISELVMLNHNAGRINKEIEDKQKR